MTSGDEASAIGDAMVLGIVGVSSCGSPAGMLSACELGAIFGDYMPFAMLLEGAE